MYRLRSFLLCSLALLPNIALAAPAATSSNDSRPTPPLDDPFYTPPEGFESTAPGTILRSRTPPFPIAAFSIVEVNLAGAHQLLYRSTDSFGKPVVAASTILIPRNADNTKLLSYQVAQDAANPNCAPSFALQLHAAHDNILGLAMPQAEIAFIAAALGKGWIVTVPDHLGTKSAFLANTLSGQIVLDNVRAAIDSSNFTNIASNPTVTIWGYSGGSLASGFAAELQPEYAPELHIAGAALGGTVPQIPSVIKAVNKGVFTGLLPAGIQGLANEYPNIDKLVQDNLEPSNKDDFLKTKDFCLMEDLAHYLNKDIYSYTKNKDLFRLPEATKVLDANALGQKAPKIPLLVYKSVNDEVSPVKDTDDLVTSYCGKGANVEYKRDVLSEHAAMEIVGAPDAIIWLTDRMKGVPVKTGCTKSTSFTSLTNPGAIAALGQGVIDVLLLLLKAPLKPIA
ncbi:hypothetical protein EYZ11_012583 [Aspergillus tanneri]|uniref:Secretory lipase n=1 Tax=Aspergillus tanneri TaxID=1220188 RepID=A0A4S3IZW4_9EURO|nr:uncharacterized protein ATNIH1004_010162 [Aspergillus tanneri]KAA8643393.1 hypothetical protein ATNIH1004_010162 [Aspergillus tanneri]THC87969.1 hypothetical protein EYZ11_012583 [Aspergillus tanneri]